MCAFRLCLGIPCPGCGFLHACLDLLQGNLVAMFQHYPLAPLLVMAGIYWVSATVFPRLALAPRLRGIAEKIIVFSLMVQWGFRLTQFLSS